MCTFVNTGFLWDYRDKPRVDVQMVLSCEKEKQEQEGKKKKKNEEFGKHVGVMRIWMYDSINQQPAENEGVGETGGGRGGSVEIGLDFGTEVKLSSRTIGSCVPLCYLSPSIFSYSSFLCLCVWNGLSERKIHAALYSFVALVCFFCFVLFFFQPLHIDPLHSSNPALPFLLCFGFHPTPPPFVSPHTHITLFISSSSS